MTLARWATAGNGRKAPLTFAEAVLSDLSPRPRQESDLRPTSGVEHSLATPIAPVGLQAMQAIDEVHLPLEAGEARPPPSPSGLRPSLSVRPFAELSDRVRSDDGGGSQVPKEVASLVDAQA